jgi:hypothetical protein
MNFFSNTQLAYSTANNYNNKINKWISLMPSQKNNISYIFLHPNFSFVTLRQYLVKNDTDTAPTLNSYIKAILSAVDHNSELFIHTDKEQYIKANSRWKEMRQKTYEYSNAYRFEQKPSPTQAHKSGSSLKFNDLISKRDELPDGSIDKLLMSFYTYIPPVRADFFATQILKFGETPTYPNYILYNSKKSYMVITDFKTKGEIFHSIEYELPSELHTQLIMSLDQNPRTFLFEIKNRQPFNRKTFSEWTTKKLTSILKKEFTITLFRHIYISNLDINTPADILFEISRKMGHSITQQMLYRWKDEPCSSEENEI